MNDNTVSIERGCLTVLCVKCTREARFFGPDKLACEMAAFSAGWVLGKHGMICPGCPAVRDRKKAA